MNRNLNDRYDKREKAPLYDELLAYRQRGSVSFHVPGHKNGAAYAGCGGVGPLSEALTVDVTEISGTDDLHHPEGVIREAQELAAECFGAEESFFLVGGSTAGNLAMILTVCHQPGDLLLVQRNVHKSVLNGLMLAGARAVFMEPEIEPESGLAVSPSLNTLKEALHAYPEAKGALVTMPNYYGMGIHLKEAAEACHVQGIPLLVDEAHGAHYGLHPALPESALSCGADAVVQSTHKMLAAMTMGAMLHVQGPRLDRALLRQRLAMVQSSSPSYPVMASLDLARRLVHAQGPGAFTAGLAAVGAFKRGLAQLPRIGLLQPPQPASPAAGTGMAGGQALPPQGAAAAGPYTRQDPFKAVIYDRTGSLSGYALQRALEARGCVPEMSDARHVVLIFTLGSTEEDARHLLWALRHIVEEADAQGQHAGESSAARPPARLSQRDQLDPKRQEIAADSPHLDPQRQLNQDHEDDLLHASQPPANLPQTEQPPASLSQDAPTPPTSLPPADDPHLTLQQTAQSSMPYNVSTWNIQASTSVSEPVAFSLTPSDPEEMEPLRVEESTGRTAAEMVIPYPPGIPILYPGERITETTAKRLALLRDAGAKCQGTADRTLQSILVFKNPGKQVTK